MIIIVIIIYDGNKENGQKCSSYTSMNISCYENVMEISFPRSMPTEIVF